MRSEIRNQGFMIFISFTLVLMTILVQARLIAASDQVTLVNPRSPFQITEDDGIPITVAGAYGSICTMDGEVVYDGSTTKYAPFYPTIANVYKGLHLSEYTLAWYHAEALKPESLNVLGGLHNYKANSGVRMTTTLLPGPAQQVLYDAFGEYNGALFAYNYVTGEVYSMLSVPAAQFGDEEDKYLINRNCGVYTPGSTMKIVTLVCALTQNPELQNYTYTCTGTHEVPNGKAITCDYVHYGPLTMSDAIGHSCNCYFASLIEQLDVDKTCDILDDLGINSLGKYKTDYIDLIPYRKGIAQFEKNNSSQHIWKLIGQGSEVNLIDMARLAGAIANGGSSAVPYLVDSIYDPNDEVYTLSNPEAKMVDLVSTRTAELLKPMWSDAVKNHYSNRLDHRITLAKTGTAEYKDKAGSEYHNRLLMGVVEEYNTAFILVVEHLPAGNSKIMDIGNTLVQVLHEASQP